jgi:hypothetical protein
VLQQLASALRVSTPVMYLRAGLLDALDAKEGQGVLAAIAADPDLTVSQKQSLSQIYETFRRENLRAAAESEPSDETEPSDEPEPDTETTTPMPAKKTVKKAVKKTVAPAAKEENQ